MVLHELWRHQYRENRYLRHLNDESLHHRGRELLNVNLTLDYEGKIGLLLPTEFGSEAIERFTHYLEECGLRKLPITLGNNPNALKEIVPNLTGEVGIRASAKIGAAETARKASLFKFGKMKWMSQLLTDGVMRIQPASSFATTTHNIAVKDNEIARSFNVAISKHELAELFFKNGVSGVAIQEDRFEIQVEYFSDYWLTCFCRLPAARMAVDFNAEAMLAIHDANEFHRRLRNAVRKVQEYSSMRNGNVRYFDPYLPDCDIRNIPLIKPFNYYYQHEFRYFWLPPHPAKILEPIDISMGSLKDIAELVYW